LNHEACELRTRDTVADFWVTRFGMCLGTCEPWLIPVTSGYCTPPRTSPRQ
jgi:hypothetical protein